MRDRKNDIIKQVLTKHKGMFIRSISIDKKGRITHSMNTQMQGKICLLTGATSGIGKATAMELAHMGATVVMVSRNKEKGETLKKEIEQQTGNTTLDILQADLASQESIRQLATNFKQRYSQLHVLINNAGLFSSSRQETVDGIEVTLAVNYLAPFLLTNLLLDVLKASAPSRIVTVASDAQNMGLLNLDDLQMNKRYRMFGAYAQSKLAEILFTYELARRLEGTGVTANALHPGFVNTNIGQDSPNPLMRVLTRLIFARGITPEAGAKTSLYLASSPDVAGVTGKYFAKSIPIRSAPISYDEAAQKRLWDISASLVKLPAAMEV